MVTCPNIVENSVNPLEPPDRRVAPYQSIPWALAVISHESNEFLTIDLPEELYRSELGGRPKAIAVITVPERDVAKSGIVDEITE